MSEITDTQDSPEASRERAIGELTREINSAAHAAHEANRAYCRAIGDNSQVPWDNAPKWQRESAREGAKAILLEPTITPAQSHDGWLARKQADGWRYGPVKDAEAKTHPCFVPYDELPDDQRVKDAIFGAVVRAVFDALLPGWNQ